MEYKAIDLGLPSGRLWADRNVGAESETDYGLYFQWGDVVGYTDTFIALSCLPLLADNAAVVLVLCKLSITSTAPPETVKFVILSLSALP